MACPMDGFQDAVTVPVNRLADLPPRSNHFPRGRELVRSTRGLRPGSDTRHERAPATPLSPSSTGRRDPVRQARPTVPGRHMGGRCETAATTGRRAVTASGATTRSRFSATTIGQSPIMGQHLFLSGIEIRFHRRNNGVRPYCAYILQTCSFRKPSRFRLDSLTFWDAHG